MQPGMPEEGDWEVIGKERRENKAKWQKIIEKWNFILELWEDAR